MTKSTITREESVQAVFDLKVGYSLGLADIEILKRVARMALAAMDSEPVAWLAIYHGEVYDEAIGITRSVVEAQADHFGWESALTEIIPLYRHAQPEPVVPDFKKLALELVGNLVDCGGLDEGVKERYLEWAEKTCRAAMLVAAPQEVKP